jgi:hypothetical protein
MQESLFARLLNPFFDSIGQTRKSALATAMSAFPPIATKLRTSREVRFVPILLKKSAVALGEIR